MADIEEMTINLKITVRSDGWWEAVWPEEIIDAPTFVRMSWAKTLRDVASGLVEGENPPVNVKPN